MPVEARTLIPSRPNAEIILGVVVAVEDRKVTVDIRPDVRITIAGDGYFAGQRVFVGAPGGDIANAQILGPASGEAARTSHIML